MRLKKKKNLWLAGGATLVYSHIFIAFKFCAPNECFPCLSLAWPLTGSVCFIEGTKRAAQPGEFLKRKHTWDEMVTSVWHLLLSLQSRKGSCQLRVSMTLPIILGRGGKIQHGWWRAWEREKLRNKWRTVRQHWALCPQLDITLCGGAICLLCNDSPGAWQVL